MGTDFQVWSYEGSILATKQLVVGLLYERKEQWTMYLWSYVLLIHCDSGCSFNREVLTHILSVYSHGFRTTEERMDSFFFTLSYEIKSLHPENHQLLSPMVSGAYTKCTFSALKKQSCLQKSLLYMLEKQNNGG